MAAAACCLSLLLLPAIVLQTCAFFSPYWIKNNATSECVRGLIYNSDCSGDVAGKLENQLNRKSHWKQS